MDGPRVDGTSNRIGVPELGKQKLTARGVEAAQILDNCGILTRQLGVGAGLWVTPAHGGAGAQEDLGATEGELGDGSERGERGSHAVADLLVYRRGFLERGSHRIMYSCGRHGCFDRADGELRPGRVSRPRFLSEFLVGRGNT